MHNHGYHLVNNSPWPIMISITLLSGAISFISLSSNFIHVLISILIVALYWWRDVIRESKSGDHTTIVQRGLLIGFFLFLLSEIILFGSFFWAYLHSVESEWPPIGINMVNHWSIPLLGSQILLSSGSTLTLGHHTLITTSKDRSLRWIGFTILLGLIFLIQQYTEYSYGQFTLSDSVFGSLFYMTTGLHAIHVIIGVLFLLVSFRRIWCDSFTSEHHLALEMAIFYWHLVDVVWLLVFIIFYWWGS